MTERITQPSEADACNWASGGGAYPSTDPGSGKRDVGYQPKDYPVAGAGEIIPAEDHNFLWRLGMEMHSWVRDFVPREWADLAEAIADGLVTSQSFKVYPPTAGIRAYGAAVFAAQQTTASGGGDIVDMCVDGIGIYYISGATSTRLVGALTTDGSENFDREPTADALTSCCADGDWVYVYAQTGGLHQLDRTDGTANQNAGTSQACLAVAANGQYAVGAAPTGALGDMVVHSGLDGTLAEAGTYATGSVLLNAVAIDHDQGYTGGTHATYDVWAVTLSTQALAWRATLPTTTTPFVFGLAADGHAVYVTTENLTLTAGGRCNLFALDRTTGALLWTYEVGGTSSHGAWGIGVDDQYLYVTTFIPPSTWDTHLLALTGPHHGVVAVIADTRIMVGNPCDGLSFTCIPRGSGQDYFQRLWTGGATKTFVKVAADDVYRRPFYNVAIPCGNGRV